MGISVNNVLENQAYANQLAHLYQGSQDQKDMEIKSLTYNLRVEEADQGDKTSPHYWENRENAIFQMLNGVISNNSEKYDFVALQECHNTWSGNPSWSKTINEAIQPGGPLDGYGIAEAPGDTYHTDNIILYRKDRWTQEGATKEITAPGSDNQNFVIGAKFTRNGQPNVKPFYIFGGHLPHGGAAPKKLDWLASAIADFEGANVQDPNWADHYQTLLMMDSNDKDRTTGDNPNVPEGLPSYDGDDMITKDGFHDIYEELHPDERGDKTQSTNHAWDPDPGPGEHRAGNREDLQFISGYDKTAQNTSAAIGWKYNFNGQLCRPSDHFAVQNTTYFSNQPTPPPFNPHTPTSIADLENELTQFAASGDTDAKALATQILGGVKTLDAQGLSLTTIESWAYSALLGNFNGNPVFYNDLQKLSASDQTSFLTLTGVNDLKEKLDSNSLTTDQVTSIAKEFATGVFGLRNPNDLAFMKAFYSNLMSGQDPATAATNAYTQVPASEISPEMNTFIQGLSGGAFKPHAPTSIADLENELTQFGASGNADAKALATQILSGVKALDAQGLSLTTIESWAYSALLGKFNGNPVFYDDLQKLSAPDQTIFLTLTGVNDFKEKLDSNSLTTDQVTSITKEFATGVFGLKNPNDLAFMKAFYSNLMSGQDPATAAKNAYTQVPASEISPEMNTFIQGLSGGSDSLNRNNPFGNSNYNFECELF